MAKRPKDLVEEQEPIEMEENDISMDILNQEIKKHPNQHLNSSLQTPYKVSSGSLILDIALGGGFGPGVHRLVGMNGQGKSAEALEIVQNFLRTVPNSKTLYIDSEGKLGEENKQRTGLKFIYDPKEWVIGTVFVLISNRYEYIANIIEKLVNENKDDKIKFCFVFDSTDAMVLTNDLEKELSESIKMAGAPLLSKRFLSRNAINFTHRNHLCIMISQTSSDIQADKYKLTTNAGYNFVGGNALLHYPQYIIQFDQRIGTSHYILDPEDGKLNDGTTKQVGIYCRVTLRKTPRENNHTRYEYPIKYNQRNGSGIWREREICKLLIAFQYLKRESEKGAYNVDANLKEQIKLSGIEIEDKYRTEKALLEALENNKQLTDFFYKKLKEDLIDVELGQKEE